jgi:hypothetical protein
MFDAMIDEIKSTYERSVDLTLGWRFLYSPKSTLKDNSAVAIIGLNPGGSSFVAPVPSVEAGNAWLTNIERWPSNNTQANFAKLFRRILKHRGIEKIDTFLKKSLTTNLVPFRTPSAKDLPTWAFDWGIGFWREHLDVFASQRVIVAIGNGKSRSSYAGVAQVFASAGWVCTGSGELPAGWRTRIVRHKTFTHASQSVTIVGIPHCSRFETRDPATIKFIAGLFP